VLRRVVGRVRDHGAVPLTLVTGPANAGKAEVAADALRALCARGEEPLLVVPTHADVARHRRELAEEGLAAQVRVERFGGLLAEVIARAGPSERPLGRHARERVVAAALREAWAAEPGARGGDGDGEGANVPPEPTPGVVRAAVALVAELEVERVTPARLRAALAAWTAAEPAQAAHVGAVGNLYAAYRRVLESLGAGRTGRASPERRAALALDALRRAPARWGGTPVVVYGFDDFTPLQVDALETLATVLDAPVTVTLAYEPGRVAFAGRGATFQRLRPLAAVHHHAESRGEHYAPAARAALHHLERHLFEADAPRLAAGEAVRLLEGGGERAELELLAEDVAGLLARGWPPGEIAVAHRAPESVADLLEEVLRARGVPFALARRVPFAHTAVGGALLGLLGTALANDLDLTRPLAAGECPPASAGEHDATLGELLAWLRAPGVLRRPELADELERRAQRTGAHTAAQAYALWEADHGPLRALAELREAATRSQVALVERVAREARRLGEAWASAAPAEQLEARAATAAEEALAELGELARAAPALAPDAAGLRAALRGVTLDVGDPAAAAEAVAVLDPLALRTRRVRALYVCGLQEGVFPAPARPAPYLSEEERRGLALASGLRLGQARDALAAERYLLYAAVSRPRELLVLSWHTADDDGQPCARSLFVDDVCDLYCSDLHEARTRRALGEVGEEGRGAPVAPPASPPEPGVAPLGDPRVRAWLRERPWSASSLQTWAACPVRWFVERLLGAEDLDPDPEPLARGSLAHAALREVLEGLRRETGSARLTPERLPRARELLRAAVAAHAERRPLSTAPERVPGARRRLEADLERYLAHAAAAGAAAEGEWSAESVPEPTHLELPFGFADAPEGLPAVDLGEGVRVRGVVDRVDLAPDGAAVVYDYKGAHVPAPDRWVAERAFQMALYMRAVEALPGVRAVGGFYQPLAGRDLRARGVLAEGEGVAVECVRGDARPPEAVRALVEEVVAAAREAAAQARAGALQARPATCGFGGSGCAYPSICRCER
jgi:RecB family exonuclease